MKKKYLYFMSAGHFSCDINTGALPGLLPFFVVMYGMDYKLAAGLIFASSFLSSIIQPLIGYWSDRGSSPYLMGIGILLSGLSLGSAAFIEDYTLLFLAVTMMGIGNAIFHPEAAKLVNGLAGDNKALSMSIFSTGGSAGFCVGPLVGAGLVSLWGKPSILFFALLGIVMATISIIILPKMQKLAKFINRKTSAGEVAIQKNDWSAFSRLTVFVIVRAALYTALMTFLPLYCVDILGQSNATGSVSITVLAMVGIFTNWLGGYAADRWGNSVVLRIGMIIMGFALLAFNFNENIILMYLLVALAGFSLYACVGPMVVLGQTYLAKNIGIASGVTLGIGFSAGGMIAPVLGWIADIYTLNHVFYILPFFALIGLLVTFTLKEVK
ncbi:MAG: MFS transporter [Anaerovibrio sp.]|uniref:MFS transporter n=1 Tax=Anaerovibrio sp. TaxID=1872532 RepID=UPI0025F58C16|nr:MFS transporter [Anaerovibrio sp.]MCR5176300.1 MFS transporter [Anaerovibrio sp.]